MTLEEAKDAANRCGESQLVTLALFECGGQSRERRGLILQLGANVRLATSLHTCYAELADAVERLGFLHFLATASDHEMELERFRLVRAESRRAHGHAVGPFELWPWRRDFAMLENLRAAMDQHPPPMLVTMGVQHAENRRIELQELLRNRGCLVIGSLSDLAALGRRRPRQPPELVTSGEKTED